MTKLMGKTGKERKEGERKRGRNRKGKKKFVNEYDRGNIRNKRAENVTIGEVIRLDLYTVLATMTTTTTRRKEVKGRGSGRRAL